MVTSTHLSFTQTAEFSVLVNFIPHVDAFTAMLNVCRKKAFISLVSYTKKGKKCHHSLFGRKGLIEAHKYKLMNADYYLKDT